MASTNLHVQPKIPSLQYNKIEESCAGPICSQLSTILNNSVEPESGVTMLNNILDNCKQRRQHNIVQSSFQQYCNKLMSFRRVAVDFVADGMPICKQRLVVNYWKWYFLSNKYIYLIQPINFENRAGS